MKKKAAPPSRPRRSTTRKTTSRKPAVARARKAIQASNVIPGEVILGGADVIALEGRPTLDLLVANTGDRPIQVGSHCHFFEVNRALRFDRRNAFGFRLQIPAGTAVRFEPGEDKRVRLVAIGGNRIVRGINGLTDGRLDDDEVREKAFAKAAELGFLEPRSSSSE